MAAITPEAVIPRLLRHLQLAAVPPPIAPTRVRQEPFDWVASTASDLPCSGPYPPLAHDVARPWGGVYATEVAPMRRRHLGALALSLPSGLPQPPFPAVFPLLHPSRVLLYPVLRRVSSSAVVARRRPSPCCRALRRGLPPRARRVSGCPRKGVLPRRWHKNAFAFPIRGELALMPLALTPKWA